jgi:hypothetical protein
MKTFQLGNPHPIWLEAYRTVPQMLSRHVETDVHAQLADHYIGREWFRIDTATATKAAKPVVLKAWRMAQKMGDWGPSWEAPKNVANLRKQNNRL